ncbi:hypothetical protein MKEN_01263700 [Mycena kentingensis (nom. inval.)]|nr:hypothetical protein MKEN_01263700 [Mycena kentingensis (nom. inval.)]
MLIKLTPQASETPTPTILFALAFPDLPQNLPLPPAWAAQLARLAADDLEAPPSMHALDRAAAFPSLLGEVLFDLPGGKVVCSFLDGKVEEWALGNTCAEMLGKVILDVEESGKAEQRAREWQRVVEEDRARQQRERDDKEREQQAEVERRASVEREAELERQYAAKGRNREQILNSPPASVKGTKFAKSRLVRSRSLLMALVATFSPSNNSSSISPPPSPTQTRAPSPLRTFARRASFSSLRGQPPTPLEEDLPPLPSLSSSRPTHNLETPPSSAPPSAPSSAFSKQQGNALASNSLLAERREDLSPRLLRRRARSTLVDAFRAHVLPHLAVRVGLFEPSSPSFLHVPADDLILEQDPLSKPSGGGYHAWVARSMLRRAEDRMRELEDQFPSLISPTRSRHDPDSPHSPSSTDYVPLSPNSISFPTSPNRQATFEPWSSDESETDSDSDDTPSECELIGNSVDSDSDGSSVHTPESGHATIGIAVAQGHHSMEPSNSSTSSYFTCADDPDGESGDAVPPLTASHIRRPAQGQPSPTHSRSATSNSRQSASSMSRREQREQRRAQRAAHAEHTAFVRMTARLRSVLVQSAASRQLVAMQKDEADRVREGRGLRRAWLDRRSGLKPAEMVQVFRPSALGRGTWGPEDALDDQPPAYEEVALEQHQPPPVSPTTTRRPRPSPPIQRTKSLAQLDAIEVDVELEHLEIQVEPVMPVDLDGIDIEVDLEQLDFTDTLDIEDVDDVGYDTDVFAGMSKPAVRSKARRVPVPMARLEAWERRRTVALGA